jgi:hypothetical protein
LAGADRPPRPRPRPEMTWLLGEANELVAMFGSSYATAKEKDAQTRHSRQSRDPNRRSPDRRSPDSI